MKNENNKTLTVLSQLQEELIKYLDTLIITSDNIGDIRRSCFMPWDTSWNMFVRDETANRENRPFIDPAITEKYYELLYAVGNIYSNETRHETALRYILEAEKSNPEVYADVRKPFKCPDCGSPKRDMHKTVKPSDTNSGCVIPPQKDC